MSINITKLTDQVSPSLNNIISAISNQNRRTLLSRAGNELIRQSQANFNSNIYRSTQWSPLSKKYAKKVGNSIPTLFRSGKLFGSIKLGSPKYNSINLYSDSPYAAAQQYGYNRLPPRPFIPVENAGSPSVSRLNQKSEHDMVNIIAKQLSILSGGALPLISTSEVSRGTFESGSPFTGLT